MSDLVIILIFNMESLNLKNEIRNDSDEVMRLAQVEPDESLACSEF